MFAAFTNFLESSQSDFLIWCIHAVCSYKEWSYIVNSLYKTVLYRTILSVGSLGVIEQCLLPLPNNNSGSYFFCKKQVQVSHADSEKDAVVVPTTMEEYCMKAKPLRPAQDSIEMGDFYDDDCYNMDDKDKVHVVSIVIHFNNILVRSPSWSTPHVIFENLLSLTF